MLTQAQNLHIHSHTLTNTTFAHTHQYTHTPIYTHIHTNIFIYKDTHTLKCKEKSGVSPILSPMFLSHLGNRVLYQGHSTHRPPSIKVVQGSTGVTGDRERKGCRDRLCTHRASQMPWNTVQKEP